MPDEKKTRLQYFNFFNLLENNNFLTFNAQQILQKSKVVLCYANIMQPTYLSYIRPVKEKAILSTSG